MKIIEFGKDDEGDRVERMKVLEFDCGREPERTAGIGRRAGRTRRRTLPGNTRPRFRRRKSSRAGAGRFARRRSSCSITAGWAGTSAGSSPGRPAAR